MRFYFTPEEAQHTAEVLASHLEKQKMRVMVEAPAWTDAPYRTTLVAERAGLTVLVEAQGVIHYHTAIKGMAAWLAAKRHYAQLYLATESETEIKAGLLSELRNDGVGLFTIDDESNVSESIKALNAALIVTPDPTLKFGRCKEEVLAAVKKFNEENRKDGLRDMCELVERETEKLAVAAARKGWLVVNESRIVTMKWSDQINLLASSTQYNSGYTPLVNSNLHTDLHSFRNARNLFDHKVRGRRAELNRQKQFAERMMMGPRLIAELLSLKRKAR